MDDVIAIAAYAIILAIVGIVTLVKKIQAEQKRRQILAEKRAKLESGGTEADSGGLRPADSMPKTVKSHRPEAEEIFEEAPEPADEPKPAFDMEEVLRRTFGFSSKEIRPAVRKPPKKKTLKPQPVEEKVPLVQPETFEVSLPDPSVHSNWSDFVDTLESRNLSDLQRAIIFTEVFGPPLALKRGKDFWKRGRLFG